MTMAAEQKHERRFLQLDRRYAITRPMHVRTDATKLVSKAITVRAPLAVSHAATHQLKHCTNTQLHCKQAIEITHLNL